MRRLMEMVGPSPIKNLALTASEVEALYNLLVEEAMRMDDDGNEGAFDASPLKAIYKKMLLLR